MNNFGAHISDRASKTNLAPVDTRKVLEKLATLPIQRWTYIAQGEHAPHMGPVAQDFHAAFGLGDSERHISTVDADGVALAAIQGLNQKVEEENAKVREELKRRDAENAELRRKNDSLEKRLGALEEIIRGRESE